MPVILGLIFIVTYNFAISARELPIELHSFTYWFALLSFHPIISAFIVYGLLNIEESGISISASLPLYQRDQAIAKLLLLLIIQSLAIFSPLILYIGHADFNDMLMVILASTPFSFLFPL